MAFDSSNRFFQELLQQVAADPSRVVPFVGAGLSRYGLAHNRMPGWLEMVERLRDNCKDLGVLTPEKSETVNCAIKDGKLIAATDLLVEVLGEPLFRDFIRRELDATSRPLSPAIISLVLISWSLIVTTNIDNSIEYAYVQQHGVIPRIVTGRQVSELANVVSGTAPTTHLAIAKIHGTLEDAESWSLTASHYKNLLSQPRYVEALKTLFMRRILFIGFGLVDDDFDLVQDYLSSIFPEGVGEFYAIVPESQKGSKRISWLIRRRGLKPIFYPMQQNDDNDPWDGHGAVAECLGALSREWAKSRATLPKTMKYFPELEPGFVGREDYLAKISEIVLRQCSSLQIVGFGGEGKTTLIQRWLRSSEFDISQAGFEAVLGFSFYMASSERFVSDSYLVLEPHGEVRSVWARLQVLIRIQYQRKILFILDGIEAILEPDGQILDPLIKRFFDATMTSYSCVLCTTRIAIKLQLPQLTLEPLNGYEARQLIRSEKISAGPTEGAQEFLRELGGHALSIRIAASLGSLDDGAPLVPISTEEYHRNPLTANKLRRLLEYYDAIINEAEAAVMTCFSIFPRPVEYGLLERTLTAQGIDSLITAPLVGTDIRPVIQGLLNKRLLIPADGSFLSAHPSVRDYFSKRVESDSLMPLHALVARDLLARLPDENPDTLEECNVFLDAAYHAAHAGLWAEFYYLFSSKVNREHRNYLGTVLGAWTTFRDFSRLPDCVAKSNARINKAYYSSSYARALKHLGHGRQAAQVYARCLEMCAAEREAETSRYINNWLTLRIFSGDLAGAMRMAPWNMATLCWLSEDWRRRWQTEHALLSFGWLAGLRGDTALGIHLFREAETAWDDFVGEKEEFFDANSSIFPELLLISEPPSFAEAEMVCHARLQIALEHQWPEARVRSLVAAAFIQRARARQELGPSDLLDSADQCLREAKEVSQRVMAPPLEVDILIEELRQQLDDAEAGTKPLDVDAARYSADRLEGLVEQLALNLYQPECHALVGRLKAASDDLEGANQSLQDALLTAYQEGNHLSRMSPFQSITPLGKLLNVVLPSSKGCLGGFDFIRFEFPMPTQKALAKAVSDDFRTPPEGH